MIGISVFFFIFKYKLIEKYAPLAVMQQILVKVTSDFNYHIKITK